MCQKWEGDCGLWVLNEIILNKYAESLKKIVGAGFLKLPAYIFKLIPLRNHKPQSPSHF